MKKTAILLCLLTAQALFGHEGHHEKTESWLEWVGRFHFLFLHFPIALISMTLIAELIYLWRKEVEIKAAARFMLLSAAALTIPTALLGLLLRSSATYSGALSSMINWHLGLGLATTFFAFFVFYLRERYGQTRFYYGSLGILFLLVTFTGFAGGCCTFGLNHVMPPA